MMVCHMWGREDTVDGVKEGTGGMAEVVDFCGTDDANKVIHIHLHHGDQLARLCLEQGGELVLVLWDL